MKTKFINYFFDKEEIKVHKLYCNLFYYLPISIALMMLIMSAL
jgi:hypothetical protein